jgi:gluconate 2-dehydrogenase gamma chain
VRLVDRREPREFVEAMAGALASTLGAARVSGLAGAFAATAADAGHTATAHFGPYEFLTAEQARLLDTVTSHIVPSDDTPGAREAHVVRFIDHAFATFFTDFRKDFTDTLAEFTEFMSHFRPDGATFLELSHGEQVAALRDLERLKPDVFGPLRDITMNGMFCQPEHGGNFQKIGWKLIGFVDQYSWVSPFGYYDRA